MTNDWPSTTGPQTYVFYCDEVKIDGQDIGKANGTAFSPTAFYENFDDGDIHDGIPINWYTISSYWDASSGELHWTSSAYTSGQCSHPNLTFDDFEVSYDVMADGYYGTSYWAAFAFRKTSYDHWFSSSGYMVYYRYNGQICLYKAGSGDIATSITGKNLSTWRNVKIVANGNSIKVYLDGSLEIDATDNTYTEGYFGFNVAGVSARYDNFTINGNPFENEIYYTRDMEGHVIAEYDGAGNLLAEYVYANGQRIAKMNPDGTIDYYLNDHLGSARAMAGSGWSANYYPFGEIASQTGSEEHTHFDFTGQERDHGTGLMYFGARYYDPSIGRFLSIDPHADSYPSLTPYNYCGNNPLRFIDPTGMDSIAAAKLTKAAENAVAKVKKSDPKGSRPAKCNIGVCLAFEEVTESTELNGKTANEIADHAASDDDFEPTDLEDVGDSANEGEVNLGVSKGKDGKSGHVVMAVPGEKVSSKTWGGKVPNAMDTGAGKRWSKKGVNYSWKGSQKKNIKWYKYKSSSTTKRKVYGPLP